MRLIDADALKKAFKKSPFVNEVHLYYARQLINLAPTVKRPHGKWIKDNVGFGFCDVCCSLCNSEYLDVDHIEKWNFCPNCGVDLREGESE